MCMSPKHRADETCPSQANVSSIILNNYDYVKCYLNVCPVVHMTSLHWRKACSVVVLQKRPRLDSTPGCCLLDTSHAKALEEEAALQAAAEKAEAELIVRKFWKFAISMLVESSYPKEEAALQVAAKKAEAELIVRKFWKFAISMFVESSCPKANSGVGSGCQKGGGRTWSLQCSNWL